MNETLTVQFFDHRGKVWDLTRGTQGVVLDLEQSGLGWSEITHATARGDQRLVSATVKRGIHTLAVMVGEGLTGQAYYSLREEWWYHANSPYPGREGTLVVTRPDGVVRSRRVRLAETPDTTHVFDPGLGVDYPPEAWVLTGNGPWWDGPLQTAEFSLADFAGGSSTPFYGEDGTGWPLHIASPAYAQDVFFSNTGQGPMWLTWELVGPMVSPRFGVEGVGVLTYGGSIMDGEVVQVYTAPETRGALSIPSETSRYRWITGQYAPVPSGGRVPLHLSAEGMSQHSRIYAYGTSKYAAAF